MGSIVRATLATPGGGLTWHDQSNGLPEGNRRAMQVVMDPHNPKRLFLASGGPQGYIARSEDGGENWEVVHAAVQGQCILMDPFDSNKVYAGCRDFSGKDTPFFRSADGGNTGSAWGRRNSRRTRPSSKSTGASESRSAA